MRDWISDEELAEELRKAPWRRAERWIVGICLAIAIASSVRLLLW